MEFLIKKILNFELGHIGEKSLTFVEKVGAGKNIRVESPRRFEPLQVEISQSYAPLTELSGGQLGQGSVPNFLDQSLCKETKTILLLALCSHDMHQNEGHYNQGVELNYINKPKTNNHVTTYLLTDNFSKRVQQNVTRIFPLTERRVLFLKRAILFFKILAQILLQQNYRIY